MFENYDGRNYIGGKWLEATATFDKIDPCTGKVFGRFPQSCSDVDDAVESARASLAEWRATSRIHRAEVLYRVAKILERDLEKFATAISMETGKNYNESVAEVNEALHMAQYALELAACHTGKLWPLRYQRRMPICCASQRALLQSSVLGISL